MTKVGGLAVWGVVLASMFGIGIAGSDLLHDPNKGEQRIQVQTQLPQFEPTPYQHNMNDPRTDHNVADQVPATPLFEGTPRQGAADALAEIINGVDRRRTTTWLNMRIAPDVGASIVTVLPPGEGVVVHECAGSWCSVTAGQAQGYVYEPYLERA